MRRFLVRLYPSAWRARYGDEFDALLAARSLGPFDVADVLLGAIDAHIHRRGRAASQNRRGLTMTPRLAGQAALVGGFLMLIGLPLLTQGLFPGLFPFLAGAGALVVALAGLSGFQSRQHQLLVWAAFVIPAAGVVMCWVDGVAMLVGARGAGVSMFGAGITTMLVGSALFAGVTYRTGALARAATALLGLGAGLLLAPIVMPESPAEMGVFMVGAFVFPIGWIALGWSATRLDHRSARAPAPASS
ncbi:MAG: hypothetical protein WEF51_01030 [Chloroflexota bacterium]